MKKSRTSQSGASGMLTGESREVSSTMQPRRSKRLQSLASKKDDEADGQPQSAESECRALPSSSASSEQHQGSTCGGNVVVAWSTTVLQQELGNASGGEEKETKPFLAAIRSGLLTDGSLLISCLPAEVEHCGLWGQLPEELLEIILRQCTPVQLAMLESTCRFFRGNKLIEKIAKHKLRTVPRARGFKPSRREGETYTMLLQYVNCQSAAAAQATAIACGAYHTSALLIPRHSSCTNDKAPRHSLYTFGRGFHGQLGNGGFASQELPSHVTLGFKACTDNADNEEETMPAVVACGAHHSTAISRKGELYSWGLGSNGELGLGRWGPIEQVVPRQCSSSSVRIVSVACGANHTLAIAETGTLWSCGKNRHEQLGTATMVDGSRLQMVMNLAGYRIVSSAAGSAHSMALASDGSLFTWGSGSHGQLGHSQLQAVAEAMPGQNHPITMPTATKISRLDPASLSPENRVTAIAAGAQHSMALTVGGAILAFGANSHGQLGTGDLVNRWKPTRINLALPGDESRCLRVVQLACGLNHTVALFSNQGTLQVRTTGCNLHGQLGHGDRASRCIFARLERMGSVVAVQAGDEHTAAISSSGDLYMWGRGDSGQLGLGDVRPKWSPTIVKDFTVVHPDKTLRRNKRNMPFTRPTPGSVAKDVGGVGIFM
mmetsp:Transcript_8992/g.15604  ORF Transcript_8992/g.15604 Transcript_8992/m.15604 type:complete len:661 (+) Transcript_8992:155-2137(+)